MNHARSVALAVLLSSLIALTASFYWPVQEAYHPLDTGWDGCSRIYNSTKNKELVLDYRQPLLPQSSMLAIIGPATGFSTAEVRVIEEYLSAGGIVLLADDFGTGNSLLQGLNVSARFSGRPLGDLLFYSRTKSFPLIVNFSKSIITTNISRIVMNHPSYLEISDPDAISTLAWSSAFSFIDLSDSQRPLVNATLGSYPVMAYTKIGSGIIVMVSDPGVFINEMIDLYDNSKLFGNLQRLSGESVLFDVAHLANSPLSIERLRLKLGIDSFRALLTSKQAVYLELLIAIGVIIGFSLEIVRRVNKHRI